MWLLCKPVRLIVMVLELIGNKRIVLKTKHVLEHVEEAAIAILNPILNKNCVHIEVLINNDNYTNIFWSSN